jgi:hypothetical protein
MKRHLLALALIGVAAGTVVADGAHMKFMASGATAKVGGYRQHTVD